MPTIPNPRSVLRSHPRLVAAVVAATLAVGAVAATASDGDGKPGAASPSGPTTEAAPRDLVTTLETAGVVQRVDQRTISYAAGTPALAGREVNTPPVDAASPTTPAANPATTRETTEPAAGPVAAEPTTTTTAAPGSNTTDTTAAGNEPADRSVTHGAGDDTTVTTIASGEPITVTTELASANAPNPSVATTGTTSTTSPATTVPTTAANTDVASAAASPANLVAETDADAAAADATLTGILAVGSAAARGAVLFTADDEPTVALFGMIPMWRTLQEGVAAGADIRQLEENLVALGYGAGITVDNTFSAGTTSAVKRWETAVGRGEPDGAVDVGEVVYLSGPGAVLSHEASVGEPLDRGTAILTVASQERIIVADLPADEAAAWVPGASVDLTWSDGTQTQGTISAVSTDVVDELVELTVALPETDLARPSGAEVTITAVSARRDHVVAVPVAAIVSGTAGGRAVRVPGTTTDRLVTVTTGVVAGGWIEITSGLKAGQAVRLPG